jgi:hypothetical protein
MCGRMSQPSKAAQPVPGNEFSHLSVSLHDAGCQETAMHQIIYLVGLIVVIMFILSVLGLR